jgi:ribosome-binding protein aMBF1 (putative translation factor)
MAKTTVEERRAREAAFEDLMASINPAFALRREIKNARRRSGLSQRELAQRMGTKQSVIARMELGQSTPDVSTLRKLADATGSQLVIRLDPLKGVGS